MILNYGFYNLFKNWKVSSQLRHINCFLISQKKKKKKKIMLSYDIKAMEGLGFWLSTIHGFICLVILFCLFVIIFLKCKVKSFDFAELNIKFN